MWKVLQVIFGRPTEENMINIQFIYSIYFKIIISILPGCQTVLHLLTIMCAVVFLEWYISRFHLYNPKEADGNESQNKFKDFIIKDNGDFEKLDGDDDMAINSSFTPYEVGKVISKSKANKAPGIDGIVYDVLKNENSTILLTKLFNLCFESHKVPDVWLQSIIHPIPKSPQNDPRIPLNYRGISLLSVISKLYTSALNVRLNRYSEEKGCIVNEQNGFREGRSCLDHIFYTS